MSRVFVYFLNQPGYMTAWSRDIPGCDSVVIDGWLIVSTVFQSYQDDSRVIMKGCVQRIV